MNLATALAVFIEINSEEYTDKEKFTAISLVLKMKTHMSINKSTMLEVIKYLFDNQREVGIK